MEEEISLPRLSTEEKAVADAILWSTVKGGRGKTGRLRILLLHNLFEGDDGNDQPHGSVVNLVFVGGECGDEEGHVTEDEDYVVYDEDGVQHPTEIFESTDATVVIENDVEMTDNDKEMSYPLPSPTSTAMDQAALQKIHQTLRNEKNGVKPYNWCQHLAGLHYPSEAPKPLCNSSIAAPALRFPPSSPTSNGRKPTRGTDEGKERYGTTE